jgi:hypothetical protein
MKRFTFRPRVEQLDERCLPSFVHGGTPETRGTHHTNILAGDVTGDGYPDVVVESFTIYEHSPEDGGWFEVLEYRDLLVNEAPTGFGWQYDYQEPWPSWSAPDFNRDGIADQFDVRLGTWDAWDRVYHDSSLRVQLGDGAGGFGVPQQVWSGSTRGAAAAADFNQDGYTDLVIGHWNVYGYVTILQNDATWPPLPPPIAAVRIDDVAVTEGHAGTRAATFTVTLTIPSSQPVTVDYATANGTANGDADYLPTAGTLTFAPGETTKTFSVPVIGDRIGEANETFVVNLGNPTNSYVADGQAVGTITDDEPRIRINDVAKAEGKKGRTTLFTFTVTLSAAYDQPVTVNFATADGSARVGNNDYVARSGTLTFAPGETTKTITIEVKGDSKREYDEAFVVELSANSGNSLLDKSWGVGEILNDD